MAQVTKAPTIRGREREREREKERESERNFATHTHNSEEDIHAWIGNYLTLYHTATNCSTVRKAHT